MEIKTQPKVQGKPLELERLEKLKVFSVFCIDKQVPKEVLENKFFLNIVAAYTEVEALMATNEGLKIMGKNPIDYTVPFVHVSVNAEEIIAIQKPIATQSFNEKKKEKKEKTTDEMIAYVKYVFEKSGDEADKKVADKVISKFKSLV